MCRYLDTLPLEAIALASNRMFLDHITAADSGAVMLQLQRRDCAG
jgi:hypothetical protein